MKFSKIEFGVGLFMVVGILAAVIMSLKVAGLVLDGSSDTYTVSARFDNIGSLKLRAPVRIGGVVIGRVDKIYIDKEDLVPVVEMSIESQYDKLSSESKVSILTSGIIGEQYIALTPGFYDEDIGSTYLKNGDEVKDTGSAVILEDLISKFLYNSSVADSADKDKTGDSASDDTDKATAVAAVTAVTAANAAADSQDNGSNAVAAIAAGAAATDAQAAQDAADAANESVDAKAADAADAKK